MKNVNHWKLIALFGGLVVFFAAIRIFRSPMLEGNLPGNLTDIDSSRVTELIIMPAKDRDQEIHILKSGGWRLIKGNQILLLEQGAGVNALRMLVNLKPDRVVTKRDTKWNEFGVGDSTGTRVKVMDGNSVQADLWIGRSGFSQAAGQQYGGSSFTYVRLADEEVVFSVEGFLEAQFNRRLDDWRDKSFIRLSRDSVDRITFRYPADSSFVLENRMGKWMVSSARADSAAVVAYLSGIEFRNLATFTDTVPSGNAGLVITFEKGAKVITKIEAWPGAGIWTVRSSHQPATFFSAEPETIKDICIGVKKILPKF